MAPNYQIFSASLTAPIDHVDQFSSWYFSFLTPSDWSKDVASTRPWSFLLWDRLPWKGIYSKTINLITIQFYSNTRWSLLLWFYTFLPQWRLTSPGTVSDVIVVEAESPTSWLIHHLRRHTSSVTYFPIVDADVGAVDSERPRTFGNVARQRHMRTPFK